MLTEVLSDVVGFQDPNVLVGFETADDAGVYLLDDQTALVQTVDFFTPIVDDPYTYGQIAAANSLSDVYAMGGTPRFALSIVGFPEDQLDPAILKDIIRGGTDKMLEARVAVIGGHSVKDPEIKFGYCVTGIVDPQRVLTNRNAQPGDRLILTKPLGTGIVATAIKYGKCPKSVEIEATRWMLLLNREVRDQFADLPLHSVTDVTGFGLLGHAYEMALGSGVSLEIDSSKVPLIEGLEELAGKGMLPGGIQTNKEFVNTAVSFEGSVSKRLREILFDPQTSGGLLISAPPDSSSQLLESLTAHHIYAREIGSVHPRLREYLRVV